MKPKKLQKKQLDKFVKLSGIGFQMIVTICIGTLAGKKLDEKFPNKKSIFTIVVALLSVLISMYIAIRQILSFNKKTND